MHPSGLTAAIFTDCRPQALAALMRSFRDLDLAEDLYQEACLKAAERWARDGQPADPLAWLIRVARNAGIDQLRRTRRIAPVSAEDALNAQKPDGTHDADIAEAVDRAQYRDDVLQLMFMCCHPDLKPHEQLALALKVVAGFSLEEIARAFVLTPDTMQRRISRAKRKAAAVAARLEPPSRTERAERLDAVQTMIYLMFNEGYAASAGEDHIRRTLCDEAIRLARLLLSLFPAQGELMGLLALCLLQHARTPARLGPDGALVALGDQNRSRWNAIMIAEGRTLVEKALRKGKPGPLQVQAAIAAVHCRAARAEDTDWREIEALYAALALIAPNAIITLNHAVATSKVRGPAAGLAMLAPLAEDLANYRPYHAARAGLLEEAGDIPGAIAACRAALSLSPTRPEAAYLKETIARLSAEA